MKHLKRLAALRRLKNATQFLQRQLDDYEYVRDVGGYNEEYRREMLNDLYTMKDRYNTLKYKWMRRV